MRVVLASIGTRGDIQPILAAAQALRRRGHEALVACPPSFAAWVRALGFEHRALGDDTLARMAAQTERSSLGDVRRYLAERLPLQFPALVELARGADAIVSTGMALGGTSAAEALGIPSLKLTLSTPPLPTAAHPPPVVPWRGLPGWINRLLWRLFGALQERMMRPLVNAGRARIGLPPLADLGRHLFTDTPTAVAADEELLPPDPTWAPRFRYTGFLFLDDPAPLDPALDAWLRDGAPPVYVGFGSMEGPARAAVVERLRRAIEETGRRCLVGREAPHHLLFPRVAAVVHHGGAGTTAAALRAGVPQVVLPIALDQFHNADALRRAGLAPPSPPFARVTPRSLQRALAGALELPAAPRLRMAERVQRSDAGATLTAMVESLVI